MTEKRLFISLFFLFAVSVAFLFSMSERGLDPNQGKNWYSLAFARPEETQSLVFIIANHTPETAFSYAITLEDGTRLAEGALTIESGATLEHAPDLSAPLPSAGRITITVSHEAKEESIYRSL